MCRSCGDDITGAVACWILVIADFEVGDLKAIDDDVALVRQFADRSTNPSVTATAACVETYRSLALHDYNAAWVSANFGLRLAREVNNQLIELGIQQAVGQVQIFSGDYDSAISTFRADLDMCTRYGQPGFRLYDLLFAQPVLWAHGDEQDVSAMLEGFSETVPPITRRFDHLREDALRATRDALGDSEYERLRERGRQMSLDDIIREVRAALDRQLARINNAP